MTITNKLKTIAKTQINHIIQRIPVSDLRSILAPRGVLIFENERESHLHTLSLLHGALRRDFFADDVTRWREDFGHRGEAIRYLSNTNSSRSWSFDVYSAASVTLLRDLYTPGEEPPPVQLPEIDDAVQAWNAQHGTELLTIDESELSELQEEARRYRSGHNLDKAEISKIRARHTSALADQLSVIQQRDDEVRDLKEKLELEIRLRAEDAQEHNDLRSKLAFLERHNEQISHNLDRAYNRNEEHERVGAGLRKEIFDLQMGQYDAEQERDAAREEVDALKACLDSTDCCDLAQEEDLLLRLRKTIGEISQKLDEAQLISKGGFIL